MKLGVKWLSGMLAFLLVSACLFTTGFAAGSASVQVTAPANVEYDATFAVTVSTTTGGAITDGKLVFTYDAAKIEFLTAFAQEPWATASNVVVSINNRLVGRVVIAFAGTGTAPAGELLKLRFRANALGAANLSVVAADSYISGADSVTITPSVTINIQQSSFIPTPIYPFWPSVPDQPEIPLPTDPSDPKPSEDPKPPVDPEPKEFPFVDVVGTDWFYGDVKNVWMKDLMSGTSATTFEPLTNTTRGMIATILYRMEGEPMVFGTVPFSDIKAGGYYVNAIIWANQNNIIRGYDDGRVGPNDNVTREQLAAILYRYAEYKGEDVTARADLSDFTDASAISSYAYDAMSWANAKGFINGVSGTELGPQQFATRSQAAAIIWRCYTAYVA